MFRLGIFVFALLYSPLLTLSRPSNLHTVLAPFTVEVQRSPVTRVETINLAPSVTRSSSAAASAVSITNGPVSAVPVVQRIESYSSGDSSNSEIRDLLRSVLSELRTGGRSSTQTVTTLSAPSSSYSTIGDSYSAPPRNTVSDPNAPVYPDSVKSKPEKIVVVQKQQEPVQQQVIQTVSSAPQVTEVVRTVYQPVYIPYQVQQQQEVYSVPYVSAVPTRVKTGVSAVAYSQIHDKPALAIQQQQQYVVPVQEQVVVPVQQQYEQVEQVATVSSGAVAVLEGGYKKK